MKWYSCHSIVHYNLQIQDEKARKRQEVITNLKEQMIAR